MPSIHLITFASNDMSVSARLCQESAREHGADSTHCWTPEELKQTGFYYSHRSLLDQPRGCGYWLFKPFIILHALRDLKEGDYCIYADAGIEFIDNIRYITDRMTQDVWLFGNQWEHAHWCKRDIIDAIMPGADWSAFGKQCQASVIVLRVTDFSRRFVTEWLKYCTTPGLIDDSPSKRPNHPEFQENRHDQAILTTLAYREGIALHWWGAIYNDGAFTYEKGDFTDNYPPLVHHHRRRDEDWLKRCA